VSGRTAKRLRSYLRAIPLEMRVPGIVSRLRRGWAALAGAARGRVSALPNTVEAARRLLAVAPVYYPSTGEGGTVALKFGLPRMGGPRNHPGKAWLRARRERLAGERAAGGGR
jgi:hypothetical protein